MGCGSSVHGAGGDIFKAVEAGDAAQVRMLVSKNPGGATAPRSPNGDTVLHHAALREPDGKATCLEALLEAPGVKHDVTNKAGKTALHVAAESGREAAMRMLLRYGASCEAPAPNGMTSLHLAAVEGHTACIQAAIDCNVSPNLLDGQQQTALHLVAQKGHKACAEVLLAAKAEVDKALPEAAGGRTPLHDSAAAGHREVVEALLKANANVQLRTATGSTAADLALAGGHKAIADRLGAAVKEEDIERGKVAVASGGGSCAEGDPEGLMPASEDTQKRVQELMDATWKGVTTRDRGYGEVCHFEVVHVIQNTNKALWEGYQKQRDDLSLHFAQKVEDVKTVIESWETGLSESRNKDINEFFLFHGTKPTAATSICAGGFNVDLSGSNKGSLYGPGVYLAESSAKADEYAEDDKEGLYRGLFAMLLCRASLGNPLVNEEVQPNTAEIIREFQAGDKHSIIGDREKVRGTFREFVLREPRQVYPAYAIIYRRKQS